MSLTAEPPLTGLWQAASWRSTFVWLCQWFRDHLDPFWNPGNLGRHIQTGEHAVPFEVLLPEPVRIPPSGSPDGAAATHTPHGDTADDAAGDISVAIELKFLLPLLPAANAKTETEAEADKHCRHVDGGRGSGVARACSSADDENALARQGYELVAQAIQLAAGQKAVTLPDIIRGGRQERDFWATHWIVKKANSAKPRHDDGHEEQHPGCHWVPVELCSPKLQWKSPTTGTAIATVLGALHGADLGIVVNYTCDVHVHVGRSDARPFRLATLKRLATLLWLAEDLLRAVRDPASPNFRNVYTWGAELRQHSRLAEAVGRDRFRAKNGPAAVAGAVEDGHDNSGPGSTANLSAATAATGADHLFFAGLDDPADRRAVAAIWSAQSRVELGRMLSGSTRQFRRLGFNFSSLGEEDERARKGPRTVEFRVLEGTLCDDVVVPWMGICCGLVEVAAVGSGGEGKGDRFGEVVGRLLRGVTRSEGCTVEESLGRFVHCLGVGHGLAGAFWDGLYRNRVAQDGRLGKEHF